MTLAVLSSTAIYPASVGSPDIYDNRVVSPAPATTGQVSAGGGFGAPTHEYPTPVASAAAAVIGTSFSNDFYYRVQILPGVLDAGYVHDGQVVKFTVWNAFFTPMTLSAINPAADTGLTLTGGTTPPMAYTPLQETVYSLTISSAGPNSIAATYAFVFGGISYILTVIGTRAILFPFPPNWDAKVLERFEWVTDVLMARNGTEQRIALRQLPRRTYEYQVMSYQDTYQDFYQYLDTLLAAWQSKPYIIPMWMDADFLSADVPAGSLTIPVNTTDLDYYVGGAGMMGTDPKNAEGFTIQSMTATSVTLVYPTLNDWPAGSFIAPARSARLREAQKLNRPTAKLSQGTMMFDVQDNTTPPGVAGTTLYNGLDVYLAVPDRSVDISVEYTRVEKLLDFTVGVQEVDDIPQRPFTVREVQFLWGSKADIYDFKQWLFYRNGQQVPFYMPTWERNIEILSTMSASTVSATVTAQGFTNLLSSLGSRTDVAMLHVNGNWYLRSATFSPGATAATEVITLNTGIGIDTVPTDWIMICWLEKVRLNSDAIEVSYENTDIAYAKIATKGVIS